MNAIKKNIPNLLTCLNLFSGCLGCVHAYNGSLETASYFIYLGALFDFFDGFMARLLKVSSPIGKELDSLADMVTFSFLPASMMYTLMKASTTNQYFPYLAFLIAIFSALRLAKFNIDERQSHSFFGIPTPASALVVSSLPFIMVSGHPFLTMLTCGFTSLLILTMVLSVLMVSDIELLAMKFKHYKWKGNEYRFLLILSSTLLVVVFKLSSFPLVIVLYVSLSLVHNALNSSMDKKNVSI